MATIHQYKHCLGCGEHADKRHAFVAMPGPQYICEECILISVGILAREMKEKSRIYFVDEIEKTMAEPKEVTAKWKEIAQKKELEKEYADRD